MSSEGRSQNTPIDRALNLIRKAETDDNYAFLDDDANKEKVDRNDLWDALKKWEQRWGFLLLNQSQRNSSYFYSKCIVQQGERSP